MPVFVEVAIDLIADALLAAGAADAAVAIAGLAVFSSEILLLGFLALSASQARRAKKAAKDQYNASQIDRLVNVVSTVAPRRLVLGRVRTGGSVFFKGSAGTNKETFMMAIALAGHEIDAVEAIYFNDAPVTLDGSGYVTSEPYTLQRTESLTATANSSGVATLTGTPVTASVRAFDPHAGEDNEVAVSLGGLTATTTAGAIVQYQSSTSTPKARVWWYLGTSTQTADARLIALFPTLWTSAHRARGVAYLVCEFTYDETAFPSGLPAVTALVRGAKVYDPRTTLTAWSDNPALLMRHVYQHASFGKATVSAAEDTRLTAAANACDTATVYTVASVAQPSRALYKAGIVAAYGAPATGLFDDLSQAMGGHWDFAGGELYLRAGVYTASVFSITDADLAVVQRSGDSTEQKPITIAVHRERAQKFNVANVRIWDDAQSYKESALTPLKSSTLITRDGAELAQEISMPAVGYAPQALHIAGVMMRDARDPLTVDLPLKLRAYAVELLDTVDVTLTRYGWSAKTFIVLGREWTADGALRLTLKETAAAIFTPDASFLATGYASNTALPDAWDVPTIGTLTVTSGVDEALQQPDGTYISRMRVAWTALTDLAALAGTVEVQYRSAVETGEWRQAIVSGLESQVVVGDVTAGVYYQVRARSRTSVAVGDWSAQATHLVAGRGATVIEWSEHTDGWPGGPNSFIQVGTILEGKGLNRWQDMTTWAAATRWNVDPNSTGNYQGLARDIGAVVTGSVVFSADVDGDAVYEFSYSVTGALGTYSAMVAAGTTFTGRYVKVKASLTATTADPVIAVRTLNYRVVAEVKTEQFTNLDVSALPAASRITAGDVRLPLRRAYALLTVATVTVRDPRQGTWSWNLVDKDATLGPRIQFRLDSALTDPAYIDAYIEGV